MKKKTMGLFLLTLLTCLCLTLSVAVAAPIEATYSGLALTPDESGETLIAGQALWVLLEDGTRVLALVEGPYTLAVEGIEDVYALSNPVPAPSPFVFAAVGEVTATSETGIPLFYYDGDTVSMTEAMIPGVLTVTREDDPALSLTFDFGDALTVTQEGEDYVVVFE